MIAEMRKKPRRLFTTGEIADLFNSTTRSVAKWCDQGELEFVYLPGGKERRIHRDALRKFAEKHNYTWIIAELDEEEGRSPGDVPEAKPEAPPEASRRKSGRRRDR